MLTVLRSMAPQWEKIKKKIWTKRMFNCIIKPCVASLRVIHFPRNQWSRCVGIADPHRSELVIHFVGIRKRSLDLLIEAIQFTNRAYIFDNSTHEHIWLAEITNGHLLEMKTDQVPAWLKKALGSKFNIGNAWWCTAWGVKSTKIDLKSLSRLAVPLLPKPA